MPMSPHYSQQNSTEPGDEAVAKDVTSSDSAASAPSERGPVTRASLTSKERPLIDALVLIQAGGLSARTLNYIAKRALEDYAMQNPNQAGPSSCEGDDFKAPVAGGSLPNTSAIEPTLYVKHIDGTYSEHKRPAPETLAAPDSDAQVFTRAVVADVARWEFFFGSTDQGEVCVGGLRYATRLDVGIPILGPNLRETLEKHTRWKAPAQKANEDNWVETLCSNSPRLSCTSDDNAVTCCDCLKSLPFEQRAREILKRMPSTSIFYESVASSSEK